MRGTDATLSGRKYRSPNRDLAAIFEEKWMPDTKAFSTSNQRQQKVEQELPPLGCDTIRRERLS
jgi:hypothetical protein